MNYYNQARLRDLCISPDGLNIYVSCDMSSQNSAYKGRVLEFRYTGPTSVLSIKPDAVNTPVRNTTIQIYPNPAGKILYVKGLKSITTPLHYYVYDLSGKQLLKGTSNNYSFSLNIETLAPGVYIFKLYNAYDINLISRKIIVR